MFWRKRFGSKEYEELLRRIITLEIEKDKIFNLMNSLRGLINRKFGDEGGSEGEEETEEKSKSKDFKGGVLLPE